MTLLSLCDGVLAETRSINFDFLFCYENVDDVHKVVASL